jgi:hypothetical protein
MLALLRASLPMHKAGIALAAIVACIPLLPMPWTLRAAAIGLLSLFACWPKLMVMTTGARQEALPSIHRNGIRAMLSLGIGGFAATWAIAFLAGGVPIVACLLYSILAATYVVLWTTDLGSVLFVVLALTMPALGRIAHESWHDFADVSPHAVFIVIVSTLLSMLVTYDIVVSRREERAFLAPCIIAGLFPLAVFACFDKATLARAMFYYEYFFIPAGVFFVLSLAGSREPASLGRLRDISFLSVLERLLYRRQRIPGERSAQLGAEDDSLWLPPRKRPASSANTPIHAPERESLLRACLGPPFAVHQRFRFAPAGLVRKFTALMTILLLGPDELLGRPAPQVLVPLFIVLVLVERLMMYLERAQDLASGSESAELALLPAWGGRAGLRSLVLPALAKPILQDAGLLLAAFWLWPSLMGRADGPALFVPAAIMMIAGTAWLLAYVCAVLADPRLADWPPQVVALAILGGSAGLWPLHAAGAAGAIASIAGAALALAACTWAASRLLRRPRPFFAG